VPQRSRVWPTAPTPPQEEPGRSCGSRSSEPLSGWRRCQTRGRRPTVVGGRRVTAMTPSTAGTSCGASGGVGPVELVVGDEAAFVLGHQQAVANSVGRLACPCGLGGHPDRPATPADPDHPVATKALGGLASSRPVWGDRLLSSPTSRTSRPSPGRRPSARGRWPPPSRGRLQIEPQRAGGLATSYSARKPSLPKHSGGASGCD
jgi:hypothetical protein